MLLYHNKSVSDFSMALWMLSISITTRKYHLIDFDDPSFPHPSPSVFCSAPSPPPYNPSPTIFAAETRHKSSYIHSHLNCIMCPTQLFLYSNFYDPNFRCLIILMSVLSPCATSSILLSLCNVRFSFPLHFLPTL